VLQARRGGAQKVSDATGGQRLAQQADHPDHGLQGLAGPRRLGGRQPAVRRLGLDARNGCDLLVVEADRVVQELGDLRGIRRQIAGVKMG
jgi:hypothetical protein